MANLALPSSDNGTTPQLRAWHGLRQPAALYVLAISLVALAFVLRSLLAPTLGDQALYLFLVPPVLIAGVLGGWGPGLTATLLSLALHLYATAGYSNLIYPGSPLFTAELARAVTFVALGIGIA